MTEISRERERGGGEKGGNIILEEALNVYVCERMS